MSAETRTRPVLASIFHRFASTLPLYAVDEAGPANHRTIPTYKGVTVRGKALGLGTTDVAVIGDINTVSGCVILITLDRQLVGTCTVDMLANCVTLHAEPGECEAGPLRFSLDHATAVVTESEGVIGDVFEFRRWLIHAVDASLTSTAGATA